MDNEYNEFINFYNEFVKLIKHNDNIFTLSQGYQSKFINKDTIKIIWRCVSINTNINPKIYIGFDKELYFSLDKQIKMTDENYTKNKIIQRITEPKKFLFSLPFPNFLKNKYNLDNWNDLDRIVDLDKMLEDKSSSLFPYFRKNLKMYYTEQRGYTLPKASITARNIKKSIEILEKNSNNNYNNNFEYEEIKKILHENNANNNLIGYELQPCKTLSALAFELKYGNQILLPKYENNKMYITRIILQ